MGWAAIIATAIGLSVLYSLDDTMFGSVSLIRSHPVIGGLVGLILLYMLYGMGKPRKPKKLPQMEGTWDLGFEKVAETYRKLLEDGWEQGGSFALYRNGIPVVHIYGGFADKEAGRPWRKDTLCCYFSSTKGVTGITIAHLVDRGLLDYDKRISHYWPAFGCKGKEKATIRHLMTMQAGVAAISQKFRIALIKEDPDELSKILAESEANWEPGTAQGYHNYSAALYANELVRRVDPSHRSLGQYFQDEIAIPFGIDFYIGLPKCEFHRAARGYSHMPTFWDKVPPKFLWKYLWLELLDKNSLARKMWGNPTDWKDVNDSEFVEYEIGGTHGFGTSVGLAKLYGILANGGVHLGRRLLSQEMIEQLSIPQSWGKDKLMRMQITWGLAGGWFGIQDGDKNYSCFGCGGMGGQMGFGCSELRIGWAYVTNFRNPYHGWMIDKRYKALEDAMFECVRKSRGNPGPFKLIYTKDGDSHI